MVMYYIYIKGVWHSLKSVLPVSINMFFPVCVSKVQLSFILIFIFKCYSHNHSCFSKFKEICNKSLAAAATKQSIYTSVI